MELISISKLCATNLGGLNEIQYAPIDWIDRDAYRRIIKADTYNWQVAIPFLPEKDWLSMPLLPADRVWQETQQLGEFGPSYEQSIQGKLPGMLPATAAMLTEMDGYRYIVRLKDRNNRMFLVGTIEEPLAFSASGGTGSQSTLNGYTIQFFGRTRRRAYCYTPYIPPPP